MSVLSSQRSLVKQAATGRQPLASIDELGPTPLHLDRSEIGRALQALERPLSGHERSRVRQVLLD